MLVRSQLRKADQARLVSARLPRWSNAVAKLGRQTCRVLLPRTCAKALVRHADRKSRLHTDESNLYSGVGSEFTKHDTVRHSAKEYARDDIHTNSFEGFFRSFKRGMIGVYHHCGEQHLQRYLDKFSFRYSNRKKLGVGDTQRAAIALKGADGKRLNYRRINET